MKLLMVLLIAFAASSSALALDCKNPVTQTDLNRCSFATMEFEAKKVDANVNKYRAKLNAAQLRQFNEVQLAWVKFIDLSCKFETSGSTGGSAQSMVIAGCITEKSKLRNKELEALLNCQDGDLSCPAR
jgi:uncharacterized protein YecT (DUF1311 family)